MNKLLIEMFENTGDLDPRSILMRLMVATVIACFIFLSYRISHDGSIYSRKFNVSLMVLTVITTSVMIVIGNNIALSLGMVGALSIVRFRTAIKDSRDTTYIFWAIVVGICCGAGDFVVASMGSAVIFIILLLLGRIKNDNRILLIVRGARINEEKIEALVFDYFRRKAVMRVRNTTEDTVEFIFELSRKTLDKAETAARNAGGENISSSLYRLGGVEYCNVVMQNDEIGS